MDTYAVIGNPIEHSVSPWIHQQFALQTHQQLEYKKILAPIDAFTKTIELFKQSGARGANITLPFKEQAFRLATSSSARAQLVKAANTLIFGDNEEIFADTTDGVGFIRDLSVNHHYSLVDKSILILGAGGSARSLIPILFETNPRSITIANRTQAKAIILKDDFSLLGEINVVPFSELSEQAPFDLIINATSAGLSDQALNLPINIMNNRTVCYDLIYGRASQTFLQWCEKNNAALCLDGLGMLVEQAAEAFCLWRGVHPLTAPIINALRVIV